MKKGLTHIYTGDGKGKTTAALGLAVRACGNGYDVKVYQFCKGVPSGELYSIRNLPHIQILRAECAGGKFASEMNEAEKTAWIDAQQALFDDACEAACDPGVDLVVLDEALGAMHGGALGLDQLKYLITHKNRGTELVLTGRAAPDALIELADYVTEMRSVKHPFEWGLDARKGIEF